MPKKHSLKNLAHLAKDLKQIVGSTQRIANSARKNGLSYQTAKDVYNNGKSMYEVIRPHASKLGRKGKRKGKPKMNAVAKGVVATSNAMRKQANLAKRMAMDSKLHSYNWYGRGRQAVKNYDSVQGTLRLRHGELITSVYGTDGTIVPQAYPISASSAMTMPFAAGIAEQYTKTKFISMTLTYRGSCGTNSSGNFWMGVDFNVNNFDITTYDNSQAFMLLGNRPTAGPCAVWNTDSFKVDLAHFAKGSDRTLLNNPGDFYNLEQPQEYIGGWIVIATDTQVEGNTGWFEIEYEVEFEESRLVDTPSDYYGIPANDFEFVNGANPDVNLTGFLVNASKQALTTKVIDAQSNLPVLSAGGAITLCIVMQATGVGFTANADYDHRPFDISATGVSFQIRLVSITTTTTLATLTWIVELDQGDLFYMSCNGNFTSLSYFTATITRQNQSVVQAVDAQFETENLFSSMRSNRKLPVVTRTMKQHSAAIIHYKRTGKPLPLFQSAGKRGKKPRGNVPYYYDDRVDEEKYDRGETSSGNHVQVKERPIVENDWVAPELTHRGMHAKNGNGFFLRILLTLLLPYIACAQQWPFYKTTKQPTRHPLTNRPTRSPTSVCTTQKYSMIRTEGTNVNPFAVSYKEYSPNKILDNVGSGKLRYNGNCGFPQNISLVFQSVYTGTPNFYFTSNLPGQLSGLALFDNNDGTALSFDYWYVPNAAAANLTYAFGGPTSSLVVKLQATPVGRHFVVEI